MPSRSHPAPTGPAVSGHTRGRAAAGHALKLAV